MVTRDEMVLIAAKTPLMPPSALRGRRGEGLIPQEGDPQW